MLFTPPHALWVGGEGVAPCVFILDNHVVQPRWHALLNRLIFSYITAGGLLAWFKNIVPSSHKELTNSTTSVMRCKNAAFDYLLLQEVACFEEKKWDSAALCAGLEFNTYV